MKQCLRLWWLSLSVLHSPYPPLGIWGWLCSTKCHRQITHHHIEWASILPFVWSRREFLLPQVLLLRANGTGQGRCGVRQAAVASIRGHWSTPRAEDHKGGHSKSEDSRWTRSHTTEHSGSHPLRSTQPLYIHTDQILTQNITPILYRDLDLYYITLKKMIWFYFHYWFAFAIYNLCMALQ